MATSSFFAAKCNLVLAVTRHERVKALVRSILDWHEFDPENYPTAAQAFLVDGFWRKYRDRVDEQATPKKKIVLADTLTFEV